jgi:curli biogenesis system outer membrane secretion channel CsgG
MRRGLIVWPLISVVLAVTLLLPVTSTKVVQAQTQIFVTTGQARIIGGNINLAQQRALEAALRFAVEAALDTYLEPTIKIDHRTEVNKILARPRDYIATYSVLSRGPSRGNFVIKVQTTVKMDVLLKSLQALQIPLRPGVAQTAPARAPAAAQPAVVQPTPRPLVIMVVVPETLLGKANVPDPAAETQLIKRLIDAGYQVVDQKEVDRVRDTPQVQQIWSSPTQQLTQPLGQRFRADILLVGQAFSEAVGPVAAPQPPAQPGGPPPAPVGGPPLVSARARVQVRVIVAATARVVASEAATASATDVGEVTAAKEALSKAADLVADALLPRIAALQAPAVSPTAQQPPAQQPASQPAVAQPAPPSPPAAPVAPAPTPASSPPASPETDRLRIAILPFQLGFTNPAWAQHWDISLGVTEIVEEALFRTGRYRVIERRAIDAVLREQGIGRTGAVDQATAARLGRILGVQALIAGTVNQFELKGAGGIALPIVAVALYQAQVQLTARVINVTTGEIMGIARGTGRAEGTMALAALQGVAFGGAEFSRTVLGRALDQAVEDLVTKLGQTLQR